MSQSTLVITLNQIISDYGIDILKDGKRVIAMFSDYRPDGRAEKNKLRIAYEFDVIGVCRKQRTIQWRCLLHVTKQLIC